MFNGSNLNNNTGEHIQLLIKNGNIKNLPQKATYVHNTNIKKFPEQLKFYRIRSNLTVKI